MIEFRNASVVAASSDAVLLAPTTLALSERRVSVIGANGSGKSTLVRLVNGLAMPTTGSVLVNGRDTRRQASSVRHDVGFLFTDPSSQLIMPTAIEDVALSLRRTIRDKGARTTAALTALDEIGLAGHSHVSVHSLSGGQRQLLALAGVLAVNPSILVADEPTTLLDLRWRAHVDALLDALPVQVIEVTHDLDAAERADRTLFLDGGKVVFDGKPSRAVALYRDLMSSRAEGRADA
ncbi:MAG: ABC transporter ATP-binding protein [Demequinaceae bacterium]|nr:ABC transporter ATP-binding protein [Demequinaceae bacterium]